MDGIAQGGLEETVTVKLLHAPEGLRVVGLTRDRLTAFEVRIVLDHLAEEQVETVVSEGGVHEGLVVYDFELTTAIVEVIVADSLLELHGLNR